MGGKNTNFNMDECIRTLKSYAYQMGLQNYINMEDDLLEIAEYIKSLPKLDADTNVGSKWIPCSERLPSQNGKYLITGKSGAVCVAEYIKFSDNGKPVEKWRRGGTRLYPIAWMELPKRYEESIYESK